MKKILAIALAVALLLTMVVSAPVTAQSTWHVDDDGAQWPGAYTTITAALGVAGTGDTIIVHEGTYTENVAVSVSVTIQAAAGEAKPVVDGGGMLGPGVHITAANVTFRGFTVTDFTCTPSSGMGGIWVEGDGAVIDSNIIYDILPQGDPLSAPAGIGIDVKGVDNVVVTNNTVYDVGSQGIRIRGDFDNSAIEVTGTRVEGNTVYNTGNSSVIVAGYVSNTIIKNNVIHDSLAPTPYGLLVIGGASLGGAPDIVLIEGNTIYNSYGNVCLGSVTNITMTGNTIYGAIPHYSDPANIKGKNIYIRDWTIAATNNVTITNNSITGADGYGVYIMGANVAVTTITINYNDISGNTYGVENTITTNVDALYNYWGDPSGPGTVGPGTGDTVSANVDYTPWLGMNVYNLNIAIGTLIATDFKKQEEWIDRKDALLEKVGDVLGQIDDGSYRGARNKLQRDLTKRIEKWIVSGEQPALITLVDAEILILNGFVQ